MDNNRKHLFGTSEKSDFIINLTDEGTKKLCAMYCIVAMIFIELAAIPYYLTKNVVDYNENIGGMDFPHYLSDKVIYWAGVVMLGFGLLGLSIFLIGRMKKQFSLADNKALLLLAGVTVMSFISALAAENLVCSMTGYLDRGEGMLTLVGYYGFFAAAFTVVGDGWRKRLCAAVTAIGAVNAVIGILQVIPTFSDILPNWFASLNTSFTAGYKVPAANGLAMTPHALAALLTVAFAASFAGAVFSGKLPHKLLYGGACILMAAAAQMTRTVTGLIGIGCAAFFIIVIAVIYAVKGNKEPEEHDNTADKKLRPGAAAAVASALCVLLLAGGAVGGCIAAQMSSYPESDGYKTFYDEEVIRTDSIRMLMLLEKEDQDTWVYPYLWDDGIFITEQTPLLGVGPDNWETAAGYGATIDRTYNEYIDTLMQRGVITAALYVLFLLVTLIKAVKAMISFIKGEANWAAAAVMAAVFAYSVQAFFNISSLESSPFFFIFAGLAWSYGAVKKKKAAPAKD
ncbi:O-antigen ligase [Ruminococcaceae bacterium FB2012]|nr:O-antigen ligase [Ruminococcaceae bacterium FB2012]